MSPIEYEGVCKAPERDIQYFARQAVKNKLSEFKSLIDDTWDSQPTEPSMELWPLSCLWERECTPLREI